MSHKEDPQILHVDAPKHKLYALVTFKYNFKHLVVSIAVCASKPETQPLPYSTFTPDPRFPIYSAADIQVLYDFDMTGGGPVCKVLIDGQVMVSKTPQRGLQHDELRREMAALVITYDAEGRLGIDIATPDLVGYVKHAETGVIIGFVREWIQSSRRGATLAKVNMARVPLDTRQKWADQIEDTLDNLHSIDLLWGDCKPDNVIVDKAEDIWLIDLGGDYAFD
ncbi:Protein kinase-like domain protein [Cordyceps fumosorosea ARSEF 2679]|uniref:Protein kinase-like domain protein n=1 Tax=Cordyceps fumosorosea (strain ARSEF 2679) TaxID=1081104 RepID=A0A167PP33_CORFA|nr:Protein kinase-like domain protein [Cordyceps fumosorosea ARSEF 2679]OAA56874.1 Protein kinase-like domain protein [Cordyceps fumosorosea ARSEF 2679]